MSKKKQVNNMYLKLKAGNNRKFEFSGIQNITVYVKNLAIS